MELDNLIFDRTQADVDRVKTLTQRLIAGTATDTEKSEWLAGMKGAYNYADLNRVTAAMDYLNDYFLSLGYYTGYQPITVPHQSTSLLPDGYTQLEYIQSSGTQYIDTGFKPNQDTRIALTYNATEEGFIYGSETNWKVNSFCLHTRISAYGNDSYNYTATYNADVFAVMNKSEFSDSTGKSHDFGNKTFSNNFNLFLFSDNRGGVSTEPFTGKLIGHIQIFDNGNIVRYYIPCSNDSGEAGLYDIVNDMFYSNSGTGNFVLGPSVPLTPQPEPVKDPYMWYEDDIPTQTLMEQYIANVEALRSILPLPSGTPQTPDDMEALTYQEANNIEKILYTLESVLIAMEEAFLLRQSNTLFMIAGGVFNG